MNSFSRFKTNSYCVGGRHYSGTNNIRRVALACLSIVIVLSVEGISQ